MGVFHQPHEVYTCMGMGMGMGISGLSIHIYNTAAIRLLTRKLYSSIQSPLIPWKR